MTNDDDDDLGTGTQERTEASRGAWTGEDVRDGNELRGQWSIS